ncbi:hypothetical protein HK103_006957 [Boothiomyces macroporosus]|uniref:Uncharacterized protein n=1 Tax=Boothiomyces macroporosus TaxID=261099 RepID=A0AAD5UQD5_9FUNG|nr:hypothetical protein HK103_006957 [Boothiomyces macroporosus]
MLSTNGQEEQPLYARNYKPTDIFMTTDVPTPRRKVVDRNRSSVFDMDPAAPIERSPYKKDHMASDIFFGGYPVKFGGYEPSVNAPRRSRGEAKEDSHELYHEEKQDNHCKVPANYEPAEPNHAEQINRSHEYVPENAKPIHQISSVFDCDKQVPVRGARRHYQSRQHSDIFHQDNEPHRERRIHQHEQEEERQWVPSVKQSSRSTSFSNIFGDCPDIDRQVREAQPKIYKDKKMDTMEKLTRISGLPSENLNRASKGKRRQSGEVGSQIWF